MNGPLGRLLATPQPRDLQRWCDATAGATPSFGPRRPHLDARAHAGSSAEGRWVTMTCRPSSCPHRLPARAGSS